MLMQASQTSLFKAEEYHNLAFKQPYITSQAILFGQPISTTVPENHLHSDLPPVFQFLLREPISLPSQAIRNWPKSVCHFLFFLLVTLYRLTVYYQINDMVNTLEQAWDTESPSSNERLRSKFTPEQRGILILVCDSDLQRSSLHTTNLNKALYRMSSVTFIASRQADGEAFEPSRYT